MQPRAQHNTTLVLNIVGALLDENLLSAVQVCEASVHLPRRGKIWVAVFTGPNGQVWKSTGVTDREQALVVAKHWEAQARAQRARLGCTARKPSWRARSSGPGTGIALLSQNEVAMLLGMSERGVRAAERRAFQKIRNHPLIRQIWQKYLAGELDENQRLLTSDEIESLFNLARTSEERLLIQKVLGVIQMRP